MVERNQSGGNNLSKRDKGIQGENCLIGDPLKINDNKVKLS
jgi:hypothetical protein